MGTILRAAAAYCFLFIVLRIIGRRSIAQTTPVELIVIFLFGGITIQAVVSDDRSLVNAFLGVITIGLMHVIVAALKQRDPGFRRWADGTPIVVFDGGKWIRQPMDALQIQEQDVMAAARDKGIQRAEDIQYAIVERNGRISIVQKLPEQS
jgi:uncharacterized membrane protein YcaP (DUF421 family)